MNKEEFLEHLDRQRNKLYNNIELILMYACDVVDAPSKPPTNDDIFNPTGTKNKCLARVLELTDDTTKILDTLFELTMTFKQ